MSWELMKCQTRVNTEKICLHNQLIKIVKHELKNKYCKNFSNFTLKKK